MAATIKPAKTSCTGWPNSNTTKSKYELTVTKNTLLDELFDQDVTNYQISVKVDQDVEDIMDSQDSEAPVAFSNNNFFTSLDRLNRIKINSIINAVGVVISIEAEVKSIQTWYDTKCTIKNFKVSDLSKQEVNVALWGSEGDCFNYKLGSIICFEGVKLTSFSGFSLSVLRSTVRKDVTGQQEYAALSKYWDSHYLNPNK